MKINQCNTFIIVGDLHADFNGPKRRTDNYYECFLDKMKQIKEISKQNGNCPIVCLGDFFNHKVTEHLEKMVFDLIQILKGTQFYSLIGNHDNNKENALDLRGTSFGLLKETGIIKLGEDFSKEVFNNNNCNADFFDYYKREEFGKNTKDFKFNIAFVHDYIMPKGTKVNYDFKECKENKYDFVFEGHYHIPYDVTVGKTRYINPGSLMRMTVAEEDMNREPKIVLFSILDKEPIKYIKLKAKPYKEIFELNKSILENNFESKFTDMLVKNELTSGNTEDIVKILEKNNVDKKVINYIKTKNEEIEQ